MSLFKSTTFEVYRPELGGDPVAAMHLARWVEAEFERHLGRERPVQHQMLVRRFAGEPYYVSEMKWRRFFRFRRNIVFPFTCPEPGASLVWDGWDRCESMWQYEFQEVIPSDHVWFPMSTCPVRWLHAPEA